MHSAREDKDNNDDGLLTRLDLQTQRTHTHTHTDCRGSKGVGPKLKGRTRNNGDEVCLQIEPINDCRTQLHYDMFY